MPDVAELALVLHFGDRADGLGQRHRRVGAVELVQPELPEPQPPQAALAGLAQVLGPAVGLPAVRARADQAALGRDHQVVRVRVERLGDQGLADVRTVGVRGVDEVDAEFHRSPQRGDGLVPAGRIAPDAGPGDPHGPEPHAVDGQVAAHVDGPGRRGGWLSAHSYLLLVLALSLSRPASPRVSDPSCRASSSPAGADRWTPSRPRRARYQVPIRALALASFTAFFSESMS